MQVGQIVDYVIDYNKRMEKAEQDSKKEESGGKRRRATQHDIDAFFG